MTIPLYKAAGATRGDAILPLNQLRVQYPELYEIHAAKYAHRPDRMKTPVYPLDCTWADVVFLSPVMDLFDHQIIAYTIGNSPNLDLTNNSLRDALVTLEPGHTPLVHSDQGFQYQHPSWQRLLAAAGATQSMSRKANCYDNAVIENWFGHLKEELFNHTRYVSIDALAEALHDYIHWYNNHRISTQLEGLSPVNYRTQTLAA